MSEIDLRKVWEIGRKSGFDVAVRELITAQSEIPQRPLPAERGTHDAAIKARDDAYVRVMTMYAEAVLVERPTQPMEASD